jgi:hypothetical protein
MKNRDKDYTVEVFSGTMWESELVKSLLENNGIDSFLANTSLSTYIYEPIYSSGAKVMILEADLEAAKEIVGKYFENLSKP